MELSAVLSSAAAAAGGGRGGGSQAAPLLACPLDPTLPLSAAAAGGPVLVAADVSNAERVAPHLIVQAAHLLALLPREQAFLSIYESGSSADDATRDWLLLAKALVSALGSPSRVVAGGELERGPGQNRIEFLAEARNRALQPLWSEEGIRREVASGGDDGGDDGDEGGEGSFDNDAIPQPAPSSAANSSSSSSSNGLSSSSSSRQRQQQQQQQSVASSRRAARVAASSETGAGAAAADEIIKALESGDEGDSSSPRHGNGGGRRSESRGGGWPAQRVLFLNDVFFCASDALRLLAHVDPSAGPGEGKVDMSCGLDFDRPRLQNAAVEAQIDLWVSRLARRWRPFPPYFLPLPKSVLSLAPRLWPGALLGEWKKEGGDADLEFQSKVSFFFLVFFFFEVENVLKNSLFLPFFLSFSLSLSLYSKTGRAPVLRHLGRPRRIGQEIREGRAARVRSVFVTPGLPRPAFPREVLLERARGDGRSALRFRQGRDRFREEGVEEPGEGEGEEEDSEERGRSARRRRWRRNLDLFSFFDLLSLFPPSALPRRGQRGMRRIRVLPAVQRPAPARGRGPRVGSRPGGGRGGAGPGTERGEIPSLLLPPPPRSPGSHARRPGSPRRIHPGRRGAPQAPRQGPRDRSDDVAGDLGGARYRLGRRRRRNFVSDFLLFFLGFFLFFFFLIFVFFLGFFFSWPCSSPLELSFPGFPRSLRPFLGGVLSEAGSGRCRLVRGLRVGQLAAPLCARELLGGERRAEEEGSRVWGGRKGDGGRRRCCGGGGGGAGAAASSEQKVEREREREFERKKNVQRKKTETPKKKSSQFPILVPLFSFQSSSSPLSSPSSSLLASRNHWIRGIAFSRNRRSLASAWAFSSAQASSDSSSTTSAS